MARDQEHEAWLNFLDEIDEYLNIIESTLLELNPTSEIIQHMDAALRAVHTIKGAGTMIGCPLLSELAHRLEDSLKIIRVRRDAVDLNASLKTLLLQGLDCLRFVSSLHRQGQVAEPSWLTNHVDPIFEQLREQLGDCQPSDEIALLNEEAEVNVAAAMFEGELDGLLDRLEAVLADPSLPCLREELEMMTEELAELGQMLQLDNFTQLCQSIYQQLATASKEQVEAIARAALQVWQQSQALAMINQLEKIPTEINSDWTEPCIHKTLDDEISVETEPHLLLKPGSDELPRQAEESVTQDEIGTENAAASPKNAIDLDGWVDVDLSDLQDALVNIDPVQLQNWQSQMASPLLRQNEVESISAINATVEAEENAPGTTDSGSQITFSPLSPPARSVTSLDVPLEPLNSSPSTPFQDVQENTVRVPIKLLAQLSDLFGEFIIQRNTLNSRLSQLENSITLFSKRMKGLEKTNTQFQAFCDKTAITSSPTLHPATQPTHAFSAEDISLQAPLKHKNSSYQDEFDVLELESYSGLQMLSQEQRESIVQLKEVTDDVTLNLRSIEQAASDLNRIAKELQTNVTRARMRPLSDIVGRFPRMVRDLSLQHGKSVELKIYGAATLIDRFILEALKDPLIHLVRNAFDHGIEDPIMRQAARKPAQGTIEIRAAYRGNQTLISVRDDGAGISFGKIRDRAYQLGLTEDQLQRFTDQDLLQLLFEPGFSTASRVTDLSGRGIGMDIVRTKIEQVRGTIRLDTQAGKGTTFIISIPFTLSIIQILLVESAGMQIAFPTEGIEEMIGFKSLQLFNFPGQEVINWEGLTIPLIRLDQWLNFRCVRKTLDTGIDGMTSEPAVLLIRHGEHVKGIYIDRFWREQEAVIRQVENTMELPPGFTGCTILEDGQVVPLADASKLLDWITAKHSTTRNVESLQSLLFAASPDEPMLMASPLPLQTNQILVVDDSVNMRRILTVALEKEGYQVEEAKDGQVAVDKLINGLVVQAVICDIEMPRLDGYGVLAELRSRPHFKALPIIMLTSRTSEKHRQLAMRLGANAYVTKPYQEQELLDILDQLL